MTFASVLRVLYYPGAHTDLVWVWTLVLPPLVSRATLAPECGQSTAGGCGYELSGTHDCRDYRNKEILTLKTH